MLDMSKLPSYINIRIADEQVHTAAHTERRAKEFIGFGYEYGKDEAEKELVEELKKYLTGNPWVQLLIDKLEDPDR